MSPRAFPRGATQSEAMTLVNVGWAVPTNVGCNVDSRLARLGGHNFTTALRAARSSYRNVVPFATPQEAPHG